MAELIKLIATEITLTTANTVANSNVVRLVNTDTSNPSTITLKSNSTVTVATFTLGFAGSDYGKEMIIKQPQWTLEASGSTVKAVSLAYY